jgi:hypothetical protein
MLAEERKRISEIEQMNVEVGLHFASPFVNWSKQHQVEYNVLHEVVFRDGDKFPPVEDSHGVKYSEDEIEAERVRYQQAGVQ